MQSSSSPWNLIKNKLRDIIDKDSFSAWIDPLKAQFNGSDEILITVPNQGFYQGLLKGYIEHLEHCKNSLNFSQLHYRFQFQKEKKPPTTIQEKTHNPQTSQQQEYLPFSRHLTLKGNLNHQYTFETFVKGPSNQFAHASCANVSENPGLNYNPLFIYGSTGLGKTHLLHAIGNQVLKNNPKAFVTYISSERFTNEMIYCLRFNKMWDFRRKYRECDVLLVDDIQFISGKKSTQEEFFHTFNSLYETKKQIVVTSDLFPQDISDIEERLRNRFQWGLIADIQPPDMEHRIAILQNKSDQLGIALGDDVAEYIAKQIYRNIRELEGALHRITAFAALEGRTINKELACEIFRNINPSKKYEKELTIDFIQKLVCKFYKIKLSDLKSKKRQRILSRPRQLAMYLSREYTKESFPEIGKVFGGKDHTTVIHAYNKILNEIKTNHELKNDLESIARRIKIYGK